MILLDSGHGGLIEGVYQTNGKRASHGYFDIHEGVLNRAVVNLLAFKLNANRISCHIINPENEDISLDERVYRVNNLCLDHPCILISVHHNAGGGTGTEIFTSIGSTLSDRIAKEFETESAYIPLKYRGTKERDFYILRRTRCPAILTEFSFMDNFNDAYYMMNGGIEEEAEWIFNSIERYLYKNKLIN